MYYNRSAPLQKKQLCAKKKFCEKCDTYLIFCMRKNNVIVKYQTIFSNKFINFLPKIVRICVFNLIEWYQKTYYFKLSHFSRFSIKGQRFKLEFRTNVYDFSSVSLFVFILICKSQSDSKNRPKGICENFHNAIPCQY